MNYYVKSIEAITNLLRAIFVDGIMESVEKAKFELAKGSIIQRLNYVNYLVSIQQQIDQGLPVCRCLVYFVESTTQMSWQSASNLP